MKKIFRTLAIVAVAALGLTACENDINEQIKENEGEKVTVEVVGTVADLTRSVFGAIDTDKNTVPSTWSGNEIVGFSAAEATPVTATNTTAGATASFSVEFASIADGDTVYAVSPYQTGSWALGGFTGISASNDDFYVTIPVEQTPLATSVDESAHLMIGQATYDEGSAMTMTFNHVAAYGKMNITNFAGNGVKSIEMTFPVNVAGQGAWCYYAGGNVGTIANLQSNTITINPEKVTNVANGVWFTVAPVGALVGDLKIVVTDDNDDTYTKTITLTAERGISFVKGQVSNFTVNMGNVAADNVGLFKDEIDFATMGYENGEEITKANAETFEVEFIDGSTPTAYYDSGAAVRVYASGKFIVSSDTAITKIELTYGSSDKTNSITTNVGTFLNGTWTGEENSVTFTIGGGTSGHRRIAKITVYYNEKPVVKKTSSLEFSNVVEVIDLEGTPADQYDYHEPDYILTPEGGKLNWSSSDGSIATVDGTGKVTIVGVGNNVTITATFDGNEEYRGCEASYTFTVKNTVGGVSTKIMTIDASYFNGTSYTANNNDKEIDGIIIYSNQVMLQSGVMQWQKSKGYIYNKTSLGTIKSIKFEGVSGGPFTVYGVTEAGNSTGDELGTVSSDTTIEVTGTYEYFYIKTSALGKTSSIVVTYEN